MRLPRADVLPDLLAGDRGRDGGGRPWRWTTTPMWQIVQCLESLRTERGRADVE
ncbi:hypothetical protein [Actinoallomurus sp. CA-150999]|uniref:hypothetical protein n=1 Tax=Actinoallomurus sp. CA-150999 TaxID=3239887 RepID=UPI003D908B1F